jgi:hypothetical protein
MVGHRALFIAALAGASATACSFLAFDDYTSDPAPTVDAGSDTAATSDAMAPGIDAASSDTGVSADPYGDVIRADGPVAWYRFEEEANEVDAKDSAGSRTAKLISGPMGFGAKGISGRGIATVGNTGGGFSLGNALGFAGPTPFTLEVWIKPAMRINGHYLFDKREPVAGGFSGWLFYLYEDHTPQFENWGTKMVARAVVPMPAGWVHLVVTTAIDGESGIARMFVNTQLQPTAVVDPAASTPATSVDLELLSKFVGEADELAIYDKALPPERVRAHYLAGKPE